MPFEGKNGIQTMLMTLAERFDWNPKKEGKHIIALQRDGQSITLEPGGQVEMSGATLATLDEAHTELQRHVAELKLLEELYPVRFDWLGMNPHQSVDAIQWMPKARYKIMRDYLPGRGSLAHYMMGLTCTVQVNLDFVDETDFALKLRLANGIAGLVNALFANSAIYDGKPTGYQSYRAHIWTAVDPHRCGLHRFIFETDCGFEDYVNWALDVPMFFLERDKQLVNVSGKVTFREFMNGKLDNHSATLEDWELHLSTLFPEARARPHIEVRSADVVPPEAIMACPALWKGVLYDNDSATAAWDLVKSLSFSQRVEFSRDIAKYGLTTKRPNGAGKVQDLCKDLLEIATIGLRNQTVSELGQDGDEKFLRPLEQIVTSGITYAMRYAQKPG